jgi:hypothetical protein
MNDVFCFSNLEFPDGALLEVIVALVSLSE